MKSKFIILLLFYALLALSLTGCENEDKNLTLEENSIKKYTPELLFEYEGIKVYKFHDGLRTVYFTNTQGQVQWKTTELKGKVISSEYHQVNCN